MNKVTSLLSDTSLSGSRNIHSMGGIIVKTMELENEINVDIDMLIDLKKEIMVIIKKINNLE